MKIIIVLSVMDIMEKEERDILTSMINIFKKENNEYKTTYKKNNIFCILFQLIFTILLNGLNTKKLDEQRLEKILYQILEYTDTLVDNCKVKENNYLEFTKILKFVNDLKNSIKERIE